MEDWEGVLNVVVVVVALKDSSWECLSSYDKVLAFFESSPHRQRMRVSRMESYLDCC